MSKLWISQGEKYENRIETHCYSNDTNVTRSKKKPISNVNNDNKVRRKGDLSI